MIQFDSFVLIMIGKLLQTEQKKFAYVQLALLVAIGSGAL